MSFRSSLLLTALVSIAGCSGDVLGPHGGPLGQNEEVSPTSNEGTQSQAERLPVSSADAHPKSSSLTSINHSTTDFTYPYPNRTNPFTRPLQPVGELSDPEQAPVALQVRGFVDVGRQRVVLVDSKGHTMVLGEGDRKGNVQVITINSPEVTVRLYENEVKLTLQDNALDGS